jgi:hypothetical protein
MRNLTIRPESTVQNNTFRSLKKRNEQIEKEKMEQFLNQPDPEQPPNHRKLPENERLQTLKLLQESKDYFKDNIFTSLTCSSANSLFS